MESRPKEVGETDTDKGYQILSVEDGKADMELLAKRDLSKKYG